MGLTLIRCVATRLQDKKHIETTLFDHGRPLQDEVCGPIPAELLDPTTNKVDIVTLFHFC